MNWPLLYLSVILFFWMALALLLTKWPRQARKSISRHAASFKEAYILFTAAQLIGGLGSLLFMVRWFIPHFAMPLTFSLVMCTTIILQMVAALLPDTGVGRMSRIHLLIANCMAVGLVVASVLLAVFGTYSLAARLLFSIVALFGVVCGLIIGSKNGRPERVAYYLHMQAACVVLFQASILYAAFAG